MASLDNAHDQHLDRIQTLVTRNEVRVSLHGSEELAADDVQVRDVIAGVATAGAGHRSGVDSRRAPA